MDEIDVIIEKFIKHVKHRIGRIDEFSIRKLAEATNIPYSTLHDNLNSGVVMAFPTAIKLARYLEIDMNHLILNDKKAQKMFLLTDKMNDRQKEHMYCVIKSFTDYIDLENADKLNKR